MGKSSKVTVGHKYNMGEHLVLGQGPWDYISDMKVEDRTAWTGKCEGGQIYVDAETLFGGSADEWVPESTLDTITKPDNSDADGFSGYIDIEMGYPTQTKNSYLQKVLGALIPAFRGVVSVILNQCYIGNSEYPKPLSFLGSRIHVKEWGEAQWYDEKAQISTSTPLSSIDVRTPTRTPTSVTTGMSSWRYKVVALTDNTDYSGAAVNVSSWSQGAAPFATDIVAVPPGFVSAIGTGIPRDRKVWMRREFTFSGDVDAVLEVEAYVDDHYVIYINGQLISSGGTDNPMGDPAAFHYHNLITSGVVTAGVNQITMLAINSVNNSPGYADLQLNILTIPDINPVHITPTSLTTGMNSWRYKVVTLSDNTDYSGVAVDVSGWAQGSAPFATDIVAVPPGFVSAIGTGIPRDRKVWMRREFTFSGGVMGALEVESYVDDHYAIYINGQLIANGGTDDPMGDPAAFHYHDLIASGVVTSGVNQITMLAINSVANTPGYADLRLNILPSPDMNPAHIIRECDTSRRWGLGHPSYDINDTEFMAAADQLHAEKLGISLFWDRQKPVDEFIDEIVRHIDAAHYVDRTGRFTLKLIRADYDIDDLLVLDESKVIRVERAASTPPDELVNAVTVIWDDATSEKEASVQVADPALVQRQGRINATTVRYPGFSTHSAAIRAAMRDLRALSNSLYTFEIIVQCGDASELHLGAPFILNLPKHNAFNMVVRVADIKSGDGRKNEIRIVCTQDVFALPQQPIMVTTPSAGWEDPRQPAAPVTAQLTFEMPYYELVQAQGQAVVDAELTDPMVAVLGVAAVRASGTDINAQIMVDSGAGYRTADEVEFCPTALLATAMPLGITPFEVDFTNDLDIDLVRIGSHAQIDEELVVIVEIDFDERTATFGRGVLDTIPALHDVGARIWFWDFYSASDTQAYVEGQEIDVKVLPGTSSGRLPIASATAQSIEFIGRAARPYPPGKLLINGTAYPETIGATDGLSLSWAHRDRTLQTAGALQDATVGDIGPEPGTTYSLKIYNQFDALIRTEAAITTNYYAYTPTQEAADSGATTGEITREPHWSKTALLLNFNAAQDSTVFIDSSGNFLRPSGDLKISTAQSKFGGASAVFNGINSYLNIQTQPVFNFNSSNFTIECFVYLNAANTVPHIFQFYGANVNTRFNVYAPSRTSFVFYTENGLGSGANRITKTGITASSWYHLAVVRNGSVITFYVDGVAAGTYTPGVFPTGNLSCVLGFQNFGGSANDYLAGYIDDFRVTKAARYTANFTPPAQQLSKLIKPANFGDYVALFNFELMTEKETASEALQSGEYAKNYADIPTYWSNTDYGETGDYLGLGDGVSSVDPKFGSSCSGLGSSGLPMFLRENSIFALEIPDDDSERVGSMTWDTWVKIPSDLVATGFVYKIIGSGSLWELGLQSLGHIIFRADGGVFETLPDDTITDEWIHYAVTMTQTAISPPPSTGSTVENECKLYRNGNLFFTTTVQSPLASAAGAYPLLFGPNIQHDEIRIRRGLHYAGNFTPESSPVLTVDPYWASTILLLNFNGADNSTQFENIAEIVKTGVVSGNAKISTTHSKFGGSAGYFDGAGDYVTFPAVLPSTNEDFTIEAWVYLTALPVSSKSYRIFSQKSAASSVGHVSFSITTAGVLNLFTKSSTTDFNVTGSTVLTLNQWVHVSVSRASNIFRLFVQGVLDSTSATISHNLEAAPVTIGRDAFVANTDFFGYMDDLRVTVGLARYAANFTPPTDELGAPLQTLNTSLRFELESVRDGLVSYQKYDLTVTRE